MAKIANTFVSTDAVGNREQLSNIVSRITPEDTPIYSMIKKGTTKGTHPEWETIELNAPAENHTTEGDVFDFGAISVPERMGNHTQIVSKSWIVSSTQEAVENAGSVEKAKKYQKLAKGIELRKDVEFSILDSEPSKAGADRRSGGLPTWLTTNVSRGGSGANGGFVKSTGLTQAPTKGTQRAFTKGLLDETMQSAYQSGANVRSVVCSPHVKSEFVKFMSDTNVASFRYAANSGSKNTIVGTADMYEGPFGKVTVVPNRVMATNADLARNAFLIDPSMLEMLMLRPIQEVPNLAKTSDAVKGVIIAEGTLKVKNEAGLGVVADLFGLTATT